MTSRVSIGPGLGLIVERGQHQSVLPGFGVLDDTVTTAVDGGATLSGADLALTAGAHVVAIVCIPTGNAATAAATAPTPLVGAGAVLTGAAITAAANAPTPSVGAADYAYVAWAEIETPESAGAADVTLAGASLGASAGTLRDGVVVVPQGIAIAAQFYNSFFSGTRWAYVAWAEIETPQSNDNQSALTGRSAALTAGTLGVVEGQAADITGAEIGTAAGAVVWSQGAVLAGQAAAVVAGLLRATNETYVYPGITVVEIATVLVGRDLNVARGALGIINEGSALAALEGAPLDVLAAAPVPESVLGIAPADALTVAAGTLAGDVDYPNAMDGADFAAQSGDIGVAPLVYLTGVDLSIATPTLRAGAAVFGVPDFEEIAIPVPPRLGRTPITEVTPARLG